MYSNTSALDFIFSHLAYLLRPSYTFSFFFLVAFLFGEGDGNPLQYSCLENPMDGGAW